MDCPLTEKIATDINFLTVSKERFEAYMTKEALAKNLNYAQMQLIDSAHQSLNQALADLKSLKESLK
jgi:hypothetical protein